MKEIQGNWFWFEVSAKFELARVHVIRSQLYVQSNNSIKEMKAWYEVANYVAFLSMKNFVSSLRIFDLTKSSLF